MFRGACVAFIVSVVSTTGDEQLVQKPTTFLTVMPLRQIVQVATREMARSRFEVVTTDSDAGLVVGKRTGTPYELLQTIECRNNSFTDSVEQSVTVTVQQDANGNSVVEISSDARVIKGANQFQACETRSEFLGNLKRLLAAGEGVPIPPGVPGRYVFRTGKGKPGDYLDLAKDGTLMWHEMAKDLTGSYAVTGNTVAGITLLLSFSPRSGTELVLKGNTITDSRKWTWEKASAPADPAPETAGRAVPVSASTNAITFDQVLKMVEAKLPDDVILKSINNAGQKPILAPEDLLKLKGAGASDAILRALMK